MRSARAEASSVIAGAGAGAGVLTYLGDNRLHVSTWVLHLVGRAVMTASCWASFLLV